MSRNIKRRTTAVSIRPIYGTPDTREAAIKHKIFWDLSSAMRGHTVRFDKIELINHMESGVEDNGDLRFGAIYSYTPDPFNLAPTNPKAELRVHEARKSNKWTKRLIHLGNQMRRRANHDAIVDVSGYQWLEEYASTMVSCYKPDGFKGETYPHEGEYAIIEMTDGYSAHITLARDEYGDDNRISDDYDIEYKRGVSLYNITNRHLSSTILIDNRNDRGCYALTPNNEWHPYYSHYELLRNNGSSKAVAAEVAREYFDNYVRYLTDLCNGEINSYAWSVVVFDPSGEQLDEAETCWGFEREYNFETGTQSVHVSGFDSHVVGITRYLVKRDKAMTLKMRPAKAILENFRVLGVVN